MISYVLSFVERSVSSEAVANSRVISVEQKGIEPSTSAMPLRDFPSLSAAIVFVEHVVTDGASSTNGI